VGRAVGPNVGDVGADVGPHVKLHRTGHARMNASPCVAHAATFVQCGGST
jgi:hypothetical protein